MSNIVAERSFQEEDVGDNLIEIVLIKFFTKNSAKIAVLQNNQFVPSSPVKLDAKIHKQANWA